MREDPACGMLVDEKHPADEAVYRKHHYFFCSAECRAAFVRNPEGYLKDPPNDSSSRPDNPPPPACR